MADKSTSLSDRGKAARKPAKRRQPAATNKSATTKAKKTSTGKPRKATVAKTDAGTARSNGNRKAGGRADSVTAKVRRVRPTAAVAVALAAGLLVWVLLIRGDDDSGKPQSAASKPGKQGELVAAPGLIGAVAGAGYPVYWLGPQASTGYEVTRADGKVQVRYLPKGESAGTKTLYLSVGSYLQPDAYKTVERLAAKHGRQGFEIAHGGIAYVDRAGAPDSVYVAYPGVPTQIEVYDPHPGRAQALVRSGLVSPIG